MNVRKNNNFKFHKIIKVQAGLYLCTAILLLLFILSVMKPISFEKQQKERETAVKACLIKIRNAEEKYRQKTGVYTGDLSILIKTGLLKKEEQYIPYSETGKKFTLQATVQLSKSGHQIPLMECGASYNDYLQGLNKDDISNITEQANTQGRYPGLRIGDITEPNDNAGNWE